MSDEWVTTGDADKVKKVGLGQRHIARLAKLEKIVAEKRGKKWWVKVTFNNDRYDVIWKKQSQVATQSVPKAASEDTRLRQHFDELAATAKVLASRVEKFLYYQSKDIPYHQLPYRGNIVEGLRSYWGSPENAKVIEIPTYLARCVLAHYEHKFHKLPFNFWEDVTFENASQELADNLSRLGNNRDFEACPKCPVCVELAGIEPVRLDSIPIPDEKTGKVSYMPPDF